MPRKVTFCIETEEEKQSTSAWSLLRPAFVSTVSIIADSMLGPTVAISIDVSLLAFDSAQFGNKDMKTTMLIHPFVVLKSEMDICPDF